MDRGEWRCSAITPDKATRACERKRNQEILELENLHKKYADKGLVILGFPCNQFGHQDPGNMAEITEFCQLNYGVSFIIGEKIEVNGPGTHPLFADLKTQAKGLLGSKNIKWNFTKFLVGPNGDSIKRYGSTTKPQDMAHDIEALLV